MAIQHTITAIATGTALTVAELRAWLDAAEAAGADPTDTPVAPGVLGRSAGLRQIAVTVPGVSAAVSSAEDILYKQA